MGTSWDAYKASWLVLRADPELFAVPLLGVLLLALLLPVAVAGWMVGIEPLMDWGGPPAALFAIGLPFAWLWVTVFVLLDALVVVTAHERLHGGAPTLAGSLRKVGQRLGVLLGWAFLVAFVVSVLAVLSRRGRVESAAAWAGGVAASLATLFVVPHLVLEGATLRGAIRTSGQAVFQRFGRVTRRAVTFGAFGAAGFLGLVFGGLLLSGLASSLGAGVAVGAALLLLCLAAAVAFACLHAVASSVYKAALYDAAVRGKATAWFPAGALARPFE